MLYMKVQRENQFFYTDNQEGSEPYGTKSKPKRHAGAQRLGGRYGRKPEKSGCGNAGAAAAAGAGDVYRRNSEGTGTAHKRCVPHCISVFCHVPHAGIRICGGAAQAHCAGRTAAAVLQNHGKRHGLCAKPAGGVSPICREHCDRDGLDRRRNACAIRQRSSISKRPGGI